MRIHSTQKHVWCVRRLPVERMPWPLLFLETCVQATKCWHQPESHMILLEEVIGIRPSKGSLAEYGVTYRQVDLLEDGTFDYENIRKAINEKTKLVDDSAFQRLYDTPLFFSKADW